MMTVGDIKKLLIDVPDDYILGSMFFSDNHKIRFFYPKRMLITKTIREKYCIINNMGTHWGVEWGKKNGMKLTGEIVSTETEKLESFVHSGRNDGLEQEKSRKEAPGIRSQSGKDPACPEI